ncbi:outer membrane protein assembly factor BamE [Brevibacillus antibioticus]|uniref:Outer membrane protein assembly factor BamE n=1 Tax=Brevibacillus antibioticus TaxID=2570228 RepID=A0A4V5TII6_9BACL|nr:outer membrane protein assembly factor BamE [Brevibacillus antibioticus]TKI55253.1 outer membrane protein assembly factor BamE [Brevibacillus antibioticus]
MKKALLSIVVLSILAGCAPATSSNVEVQPVSNGSVPIEEDLLKKMKIVNEDSEIGSGELTKENISLGGIHIGDSAEAVRKLLGEPTSKGMLNSTPFPLWHYEKQNIYVAFYYKGGNNPSPDNPKGGVVSIVVNEPSDVKTDRGFGIGSSLKDVMQSFQSAYAYEKRKDTDTQYVVISGSSSSGNVFYPSLRVLLKGDKVTSINISNEEEQP